MEIKDYRLWKDYYFEVFIPAYENAISVKSKFEKSEIDNREMLMETVSETFICSMNLLKIYLSNNGLWLEKIRRVLRFAFYTDIISDGDEWIQFGDLMFTRTPVDLNVAVNFVLNNFFIFEKLKNKFQTLSEENG